MKHEFLGWNAVAERLLQRAENQVGFVDLNAGQRASLQTIARRIPENGIVIADEER